ncbi:MAG: asparagine--tRNA ligase [Pseudomonadota bacterium]|nr:asparagine--tRNA ligase [Gammaproteobacteria bacterium]MBU1926416.1 asparagine--tRNA ligase [Gammaproteobacteria bacterium]MBU2545766.1 asparagine--tRNA ligase [Gammaproteobacteria bacterium]
MSETSYQIYSIDTLLSGEVPYETPVTVYGWLRTRRDSKAGISFLNVNDGSCFHPIQVVAPQNLPNYHEDVLRLTAGCSLAIHGTLQASPGKEQAYELHADSIDVLGWVENPDTYPISPKHHSMEYLREHLHLRARTNVIGAAIRVRNCISQAIHRYMSEHGFCWIHTPLITSNDCEGAGEMFRVSTLDLVNLPRTSEGQINFEEDFFGRETFLTVSGQLQLEAYCCALSKVYTFGPAFRAENSNTTRHLAELWMVEPEIAFADLFDNAFLAEHLLRFVCRSVLEERSDDMSFFEQRVDKECMRRLEKIVNNKFVHMEYSAAIEDLQKANKKFEFPVEWGMDLQSEHERYLAEELVDGPVVVLNYPKEIKSFYMRQNDDGKTVAAMDILVPGIGEIVGGSQREERLEVLEARMDELHMDKALYDWYLDLRRYGTVPHSGFGIGLERLVNYVTGIPNIRDVIPFPRTSKHIQY